MSDTRRRLFATDEDGHQLYMYGPDSPYTTAGSLKDHGLDVPAELVDAYEDAVRVWEETQKRLQAWLAKTSPPADGTREVFESVVLYWQRTWDQYDAVPTCDHAEAVERLRSKDLAGPGGESCRRCGSYVGWAKRAYNKETRQWEDLEPPFEIKVWV